MEKLNNHRHLDLAYDIGVAYAKMCNDNCCGECKYAFLPNCKILFTLDYIDKKTIEDYGLTMAVSGAKHKVLECEDFHFDSIEEE
ncbi:MAG: hypothetical protein ACRC1T_05140 [Clostridium chrysemydis]|uniref:hypothetical protein n=1 Tax=Clostridium chrysemydis TaxID=2665504 RepID=UPI003F3A102B